MAISYGGVSMSGGMMGGSGDYGLSDPVGILGTIKGLFSFLPGWLATLLTALLLLLIAAVAGWIIGKVVGGILYPNPDKQSILNKQQKFACLGAGVLLFGLTIFALTYQPKPETEPEEALPVGGELLPEDGELTTPEGEPDAPADDAAEEPAEDGEEAAPETEVKTNPD